MAPEWDLHVEGKVVRWNEDKLKKKLRNGDLSGMELARPDAAAEWRPLHATGLFRESVPHIGDPEQAARGRKAQAFWTHLGIFAAVFAGNWVFAGEPPWWLLIWGVFVAIQGVDTFRALRATPSTATPELPAAPQTEAQVAVAALADAGWSGDVAALRALAAELGRRRILLDASADEAALTDLRREREELATEIATTEDAATADALQSLGGALDARIEVFENTARLAARTRARERALIHQAEALRLALVGRTEDVGGSELGEAVTRMRRELEAEAEVTDALARARQAQRTR